MAGEVIALEKAALPDESLRGGREWNEPAIFPPSSSGGERGEDTMLGDLKGKIFLGGANPDSSNENFLCFPGDPLLDPLGRGEI